MLVSVLKAEVIEFTPELPAEKRQLIRDVMSVSVLKAEVIEFTPELPAEKRQLIRDVGKCAQSGSDRVHS